MYAHALFLLSLVTGPDVDRLGAESYHERESAHERLQALGVLAAPELRRGATSDIPEVRFRSRQLLARCEVWELRIRAAVVLGASDPPDPVAFQADDMLRRYTHRAAVELGCDHGQLVSWLLPESEWHVNWFWNIQPVDACAEALERCRRQLGAPVPFAPRPRPK